jgi:Tol biopolymer transport system component
LSDIDERIREAMERSTAPADPAGAFERVVSKRARRRTVRRAQTVALTVAVVVVTSSVTFTLGRMFGSDRREEAAQTPSPPLSLPDIAFAGEVEGKPGIYAMKADGSDVELLTKEPGPRISPSWSPDGTKLAYSDSDDDLDIYVLDLATGEEHRVTDNPTDDFSPAWSPDGSRLVFVSHRDGGSHLYLIDAGGMETGGSPVTRLTSGASSNYDPAWSADGTQIYFAHDPLDGSEHADLYVLNAPSGSQPQPPPPVPLLSEDASVFQPAPSPDGTRLAFVSQPNGVSQIFAANADGSNARQLTHGPGHKTSPSWSPDGQQIVFSSGIGRNDLFVMNSDGSDVRQITELDGDLVTPAWNPSAASPTEPGPGSEGEQRCLSEAEAAGDPSLRKPGSLRGDVDGDGLDDEVSVAIDPQSEEPTCRYFLVVHTAGGAVAARIDLTYLEGIDQELFGLQSLAEVNDQPGLEVFVRVHSGVAMEFGQLYTMAGGTLTLMVSTGPDSDNGLFAYGGSLSGLSGVDCAEEPGHLILGTAAPDGNAWTVDRWPLVVEGYTVRLDPSLPEAHEQHTLSDEEIASGELAERFREFGEAPFDDCPGFVSAA